MKKKSVKVNAVLNAFRTLINILFPLITFKYASQVLIADNLGKVNFATSIISYFILIADFGITTYAAREGAKYRRNKKAFQEFALDMFSLNIVTTLISYLILGISLVVWNDIRSYRYVIIIQSISLIFTLIGAAWVNTLYEDYKSILYRSVAVQVLSLILLLLLVKESDDYYQYAAISVLAQSGTNLFNYFYIRKRYCQLHFRFRKQMFTYIKPLMVLCGISVTTTIYVNIDTTMIGLFGSDVDVAYYAVAVKVYNVVKALLAAIIIVCIPRLTELNYKGKELEYKNMAYKTENMLLTLTIPFIVGLIVLSKEAIIVVSGNEYLSSVPTLKILCIAILFSIIATYITDVIILPKGYEKGAFLASAVSAIVNIVLNFWFIPHYGYNGAAMTTVISEAIVVLINIIYVYYKEKNNLIYIFNKAIFINAVKCIIGVALFVFVDYWIYINVQNILLRIVLILISSSIIYVLSLFILKHELVSSYINNKKNINGGKRECHYLKKKH